MAVQHPQGDVGRVRGHRGHVWELSRRRHRRLGAAVPGENASEAQQATCLKAAGKKVMAENGRRGGMQAAETS